MFLREKSGRPSPEKIIAFVGACLPALWLAWRALNGELNPARPVNEAIHAIGYWTMLFIVLSLAVSPARRLFAAPKLINLRRTLGVTAFCYALLHLTLYVVEQKYDLGEVVFLLDDVERQVQQRVAERGDAKRAAQVDQLRRREQPARRRHREREHDEQHGPVADRVDRLVDRSRRIELAIEGAPSEPERRQAGANEGDDLLGARAARFLAQEHQSSSAGCA